MIEISIFFAATDIRQLNGFKQPITEKYSTSTLYENMLRLASFF